MDYTVPGREMSRRRVRFLIGTPDYLLTAIDLEKRRIRHYRMDRINLIADLRTGETFAASQFVSVLGDAFVADTNPVQAPAIETALILRKSMICQLSIMTLLARSDGSPHPRAIETIMDYARRESRFAVREGWVPRGPKADAWQPLRTMIEEISPRRSDLDVYVATLNEEWENPRRMAAFNDALIALAGLSGRPGPGLRMMVEDIERLGRDQLR
jgi:hypothetical protein